MIRPPRTRLLAPALLVLLLAIAVPAGAATGLPIAPTASPSASAHSAPAAVPPRSMAPSHPASGGPVANGRGVFFSTQWVPNVSSSALTCYGTTCVNVSNDPSINWTSYGTLAVAYTAWTNATPCRSAAAYAQSEIGFVVSTNGGTSWSTPKFLGAPSTCSAAVATAEPDAWQPSLTSLANGTLVLVYVAFNSTAPLASLGLGPSFYSVSSDRLLLTESYDNGTSWTTPTTLNVSDDPTLTPGAFTAERPSATSIGDTVYVAWANVTESLGFSTGTPVGSGAVQLLVSTNNGTTWPSSPTTLPVVRTPGSPAVAMNPNAIVLPNGQLSVAYTTNLTYHPTYDCQHSVCLSGTWEADVVVASSTNNGSTFSVATAGAGALVAPSRYADAFFDPSPELAYGGPSHQMVVTFAAGDALTICISGSCGPVRDSEVIYVGNSSTAGASWTAAHSVMDGLWGYGPFGTYYTSFAYNPGVVIDRNGTVDLVFTYDNYTVCQLTTTGGTYCGPQQEEFAQSTDNGSTFVGPELVSRDWSQLYNNPSVPDGEYATAVAAGGQLWLAWSLDACPGWASGLAGPFPTSVCYSEVALSQLDTAAGITLTFSESGLTSGVVWNVTVMGNARAAAAPATLSVSGVPVATLVDWGFSPAIAPSYGERFAGTTTSSTPGSYATNTAIPIVYTSQVLVNVGTVPSFGTAATPYAPYCFAGYPATAWDDPTCPTMNYNVTVAPPSPLPATGPGPQWVSPGSAIALAVVPIGSYYCTVGANCYDNNVLNLTFQSWTGTGNGSVNTTANSTTIVANGPLNETANFLLSGYCYVTYTPTPTTASCLQDNTTLTFHESGLPSGTGWTVSVESAFGSATVSNSTPWLPVVGAPTIGPATFQVWTVPASGGYWVPSTTPGSPVQLPAQGLVDVNFTFDASVSGLSFPLTVSTQGLPAALPWSYSVNGTSYGVSVGNSTVTTAPAGSYVVGGSAVEESNGTEFVVTGVDVRSDVVNRSGWTNTTAPGTVTIHGPAEVVLVYSARYWLDVEATMGGTAGPSAAWYAPATAVTLAESASVGYHFTAWAGTGAGASSGAQDAQGAPTIHVDGPVTELANFVQNASLGDAITVVEVGLPAGVGFSFSIGSEGYSANGSTTVTGVSDGPYAFHAANATEVPAGEVGAVTAVTSSYATNPNGTLAVVGNGMVQVNYTVLDQLVTSVVGSGTIAPGTEWVGVGTVVTVTATPATGWQFDALSTVLPYTQVPLSADTFHVQVNAPGTVIAQFSAIPAGPPPTYTLSVNATGLPVGLVWNVSAGPLGTSGSGGELEIAGLGAGSYNVTAPTVYVGDGTRYVPTPSGPVSVTLPATGPVKIAFAVEYEVSIVAGAGGTAGPATEWVAPGTAVALTEHANSTEVFVNWTGTGSGAYSGTSAAPSVTVGGPVSEVAVFGPAPTTSSSTSAGSSFPILGVGLLVVLLVVGAVVGLLVGRRSGGSGGSGTSSGSEAIESPASEETVYGETPAESATDEGPSGPSS